MSFLAVWLRGLETKQASACTASDAVVFAVDDTGDKIDDFNLPLY